MKIFLDPQKDNKPLSFFFAANRKEVPLIIFNIIFYALGAVSVLGSLYFLGKAVDIFTGHASGDVRFLLILVVLCVVGYEVFYRIGHIFEVWSLSAVRRNIKKALFDHSTALPFNYFIDRFAGEIAHKVVATADGFERLVIIITNDFIESVVVAIISAVVLSRINYLYGLFISIWILLYIVISFWMSKKMNLLSNAYATAEAKTTGTILDFYGNISSVKVYGKKEDFNRAHNQIDFETKALRALGIWDIITFNFQGIFIILLSIGFILISSYLYQHNIITVGVVVFVSTVALRLFNIIWDDAKKIAEFIRYRGEVANNLEDLVKAPIISDGLISGKEKSEISVEYKNITFGYSDQKLVLNNFSLLVKPGQKVGIVGLSGAGKTTFANLLLRFFDPQSGEILLNGINIKEFTQEFLRSHISYISQDTLLFHTSIEENISYGSKHANFEDVKRAANLAYADEFIETLPNKYKSVVGDRGIKLSGGQRQRIAIARAILADRPLFLLDEATSALDSDSEAKIQKGLAILIEDKTVIAIAHRLSTLAHMDRIIFFEAGKIIEDGTHAELIAKGGKYAKLWQMQAGGFLPDTMLT